MVDNNVCYGLSWQCCLPPSVVVCLGLYGGECVCVFQAESTLPLAGSDVNAVYPSVMLHPLLARELPQSLTFPCAILIFSVQIPGAQDIRGRIH